MQLGGSWGVLEWRVMASMLISASLSQARDAAAVVPVWGEPESTIWWTNGFTSGRNSTEKNLSKHFLQHLCSRNKSYFTVRSSVTSVTLILFLIFKQGRRCETHYIFKLIFTFMIVSNNCGF